MCILFILRKKNTKWPFLIATNREEFYNRKFLSPGQHWEKYPSVFAGKDKKAGGSWLGVNKYGVCVSILNRSSNIKNQKSLKTRGEIVINALKYKKALEAKNQFSKNFEKRYNFFNLVIADNKSAYWIKYDDYKLKINTIPYGYSIIDNLDLNDESSLRQKINKNFFKKSKQPNPEIDDYKDWAKLLTFKKQNVDEKLASIYVSNNYNNYGTVCSSIIGLPNKGDNRKSIFWVYRNSLSAQPSFKKLNVFS